MGQPPAQQVPFSPDEFKEATAEKDKQGVQMFSYPASCQIPAEPTRT